jgi:hypothetical protein
VAAVQGPRHGGEGAPKRVLLQKLVGDVRLVLQGEGHPMDDEVDLHIIEAVAMAPSVRAVLVFTDGPDAAGPNAGQRARMARAGLLRVPTAVVTESVLARGVMTAVSWLGTPIKGFASEDLFRAFEFLKVSAPVRARIPAQLEALKAELHGRSIPPRSSSVRPAYDLRPPPR